jgi:uncharacterized Rmd1/YagE family protein
MSNNPLPNSSIRLEARAVLLGDRLMIDRSGYTGVISTAPFGYRKNDGYVVVFRYGAVVLIGLREEEERSVLDEIRPANPGPPEEERFSIEIRPDQEEGLATNGGIQLKELTVAHVLVLADILAKSVALASYEREIASVFDTIEPAATALAVSGESHETERRCFSSSGRRYSRSIACPAVSPLPRSRRFFGSTRNSSVSMRGLKTSLKLSNGARC